MNIAFKGGGQISRQKKSFPPKEGTGRSGDSIDDCSRRKKNAKKKGKSATQPVTRTKRKGGVHANPTGKSKLRPRSA